MCHPVCRLPGNTGVSISAKLKVLPSFSISIIRPDDNGDGGSTRRLPTVLGHDHDVGDGAVEVAEIVTKVTLF